MKRIFFRRNFLMFISLTVIPVLIFSLASFYSISRQAKDEAEHYSRTTLDLSKQSFDVILSDIYHYKVFLDTSSDINILMLKTLLGGDDSYESRNALSRYNTYLTSSTNAKPQIHSMYLTLRNSDYFIYNGNLHLLAEASDQEWHQMLLNHDLSEDFWLTNRQIINYKFDTAPTNITTIFQRTKYNGILAINLEQKFFNSMLDSISTYNDQILLTLNHNHEILFYNQNVTNLSEELFTNTLEQIDHSNRTGFTLDGYYINFLPSDFYNLTYITFTPMTAIYALPNTILATTLLCILLSITISIFLAYTFTDKNYAQLHTILDTFEAAQTGRPIPKAPAKANDPYFFILNNIINIFVNQTYLKTQLEAKKYAALSAELAALQYQINPHFLFNTLQSINLEILRIHHEPSKANQMISQLSALLRYSLKEPMQKVTIGEEIAMTKNYIDIQKYRHHDSFSFFWEYEEDAIGLMTLRLLLQPLIENSISHSLPAKNGQLFIKCKIFIRNEHVYFQVIDNGTGISQNRLLELTKSFEEPANAQEWKDFHIGLKNINQRLRLCYGSDYRLRLKSKEGMGTIAEFHVPAADIK